MKNKKLILAYSGGLDTSVILKWLIDKVRVACHTKRYSCFVDIEEELLGSDS